MAFGQPWFSKFGQGFSHVGLPMNVSTWISAILLAVVVNGCLTIVPGCCRGDGQLWYYGYPVPIASRDTLSSFTDDITYETASPLLWSPTIERTWYLEDAPVNACLSLVGVLGVVQLLSALRALRPRIRFSLRDCAVLTTCVCVVYGLASQWCLYPYEVGWQFLTTIWLVSFVQGVRVLFGLALLMPRA
jgi:hypothetical protein